MIRVAKVAVEAPADRPARGKFGENEGSDECDDATGKPATQDDRGQMRSLRHYGRRPEYARTDHAADRNQRQIECRKPAK
jgi:hypothetical protein